MSERLTSNEGEKFVVPSEEHELDEINRQNMTIEQSIASGYRERAYAAYGKDAPSMEYTATRDGHQNNGILRGTVRGIDLELRRQHAGYSGKNNVGGASGDIYEYSGTMNDQPLKPEDAEKLFELYGKSPRAENLDRLTTRAAESIQPKEAPADRYQESLDTLFSKESE